MKTKQTHLGFLILITITGLLVAGFILPPLVKPKAQSTRLTDSVNNIPSYSVTITNPTPSSTPSK